MLTEYLHQFRNTVLRNIDIRINPPTFYSYTYTEPFFHYKPLEYIPNMHIQGYFQSEKYFDSSLVRNMFKIDNETQDFLKEKYDEILELPGITSINVRRGDYLKVQDHLPVCSLNYYNKAIEIIGKDKPYLITSDDLEWCRQNFKGDKFYFAECTNPTYDLYLPSMCQNHIISNSTFSWWGAWLNNSEDKKVIAPLRWFGPKYAEHNTQDLLPEKWIKI